MVNLGPLSDDIDLATGSARKCRHLNAEPVELLDGGELVAWLCPGCGEQLPPEPDPHVKSIAEAVTSGAVSPDDVRAQMLAVRIAAVRERFGG